MTDVMQDLRREIAELPVERQKIVLAYVRFLKLGEDVADKQSQERFEKSWERLHAKVKKLNITEEDIEAEIRAVRISV